MFLENIDEQTQLLISKLSILLEMIDNSYDNPLLIENEKNIIDILSLEVVSFWGTGLFKNDGTKHINTTIELTDDQKTLLNSLLIKVNNITGTKCHSLNAVYQSLQYHINLVVNNFSKNKEGKKVVMDYAIDNNIDLSSINENIIKLAFLHSNYFSYEILKEVALIEIESFINDEKFLKLTLSTKKYILFLILNLSLIKRDKSAQEFILFCAKNYQTELNIDDEYLTEIKSLSDKYISLHEEIIEIINE